MRPRQSVFVDAVLLIGLIDPEDQWHNASVTSFEAVRGRPLVTTDGIIQESLALLARQPAEMRVDAAGVARNLRGSRMFEVIAHTSDLIDAGLNLYDGEFRFSSLSLQDCISIHVMRQRGITDILTADREFIRAGFTPLML